MSLTDFDRLTLSVSRTVRAHGDLGRENGDAAVTEADSLVEVPRLRDQLTDVDSALLQARHIGVAVGILMAHRGLTQEQAFAILRRASQRRHREQPEVASELLLTGTLPLDAANAEPGHPPK